MLHHEESIARFVETTRSTGTCDAVIVEGSVARGTERPDSDVDLYLVVDEDAFARARGDGRLSYVSGEGVTYEGGYFDIKLVTLDYLDQAALRGDDPCRASFESARVVWSTVDGLEERLARILDVSEESWSRREAAFMAHARLQNWYFLPQAFAHGNTFLLHHAAVHLVMAAGRVVESGSHAELMAQGGAYAALVGSLEAGEGTADAVDALAQAAGAEVARQEANRAKGGD